MKYPIIIAVFFFSLSSLTAGGPWPQKKGNVYFKLSEWWLTFDQHYTDQGLLDPNITTGLFTTSLYTEYGISNRLTGILYAPLLTRNFMNNLVSSTTDEILVQGEAINRIGDVDLSLKYALSKGDKFILYLQH